MGSPHPVVTSYRSWGCCPRLFQLGLDLGFRSEKVFSIWVVLGQIRGQRSCANSEICPITSERNQFLSQSHSLVKGCIVPNRDRWGRDCLALRPLLCQEGWRPVAKLCTHRIVWYPHQWFLLCKGQACLFPNICYHSAVIHHCVEILILFSIPSQGNVPSPAPTCVLAPPSTAKYQLAVENVEVTWLQPMATFSSDPSLVP